MSKEERRNLAREKARALQIQEQKRAKRNRILVIVGIVAAIALVAFTIFKIVTQGNTADTGNYDGQARSAKLAQVQEDYGILLGQDGAAITQPQADLPLVGVYADLMCPHCVDLEQKSKAAYGQQLAAGQVQIAHYPVQIMNTGFSRQGTAALFYVATYAPEYYAKFHEQLFARSHQIIFAKTAKIPTAAEIADMAKAVGIPEAVVNDLPASIISDEWQQQVKAATEKFRAAGWKGTPTIVLNGKETTAWQTGGMAKVFEQAVAKSAK